MKTVESRHLRAGQGAWPPNPPDPAYRPSLPPPHFALETDGVRWEAARAGSHLRRGSACSASRVMYCAPRSAVQAASRVPRLVLMRPPARQPVRHRDVTPSSSPPVSRRPPDRPAPLALSQISTRPSAAPRSSAAQAPPVSPAPTTSTRDMAWPGPPHRPPGGVTSATPRPPRGRIPAVGSADTGNCKHRAQSVVWGQGGKG